MFKSISINRYRGIRHLSFDDLSRVNLFIGKNNTGKTSVLEAISILSCNKLLSDRHHDNYSFDYIRAIFSWVYKLSFDRNYDEANRRMHLKRSKAELNKEVLSSIMYGRKINLFDKLSIQGTLEKEHVMYGSIPTEEVSLKYTLQYEQIREIFNTITKQQERIPFKVLVESPEELESLRDKSFSFEEIYECYTSSRGSGVGGPFSLRHNFDEDMINYDRIISHMNMQYIRTNTFNNSSNSLLYDKIIFDTTKLDRLLYALRLIEPNVERFAYQENEFGERLPKVKLANNDQTFSISNMGDGMNRILTIVLSLVNCEKGYLIIDEIENGLHYSVQKDLWDIIFQLADLFNIQVFATTHSNDTIYSFTDALNSQENKNKAGKAFRIQENKEDTIAIEFSQKELSTSTKFDVEIR